MGQLIDLATRRQQRAGEHRDLQVGTARGAGTCGLCGGVGGHAIAQVSGTGVASLVVTGMPCMACGRVGRGSAA